MPFPENLHPANRKPLQCASLFLIFRPHFGSGRSVAWLARLFRVQEVVSSNLTAPTICSPSQGIPQGKFGITRTWRNWQTRYFEVVVPYGVQVQVLPCAPNMGSGTSSGSPLVQYAPNNSTSRLAIIFSVWGLAAVTPFRAVMVDPAIVNPSYRA